MNDQQSREEEIEKELKKGNRVLEEIVLCTNPVPEKIRYEDYFLKKVDAICDLVKRRFGPMEWYGFLIAREENPSVIIDTALGFQTAGMADVEITELDIARVVDKLESGYKIIGWDHSHDDMPYMEFSEIDEKNKLTVANSATLNTQVISKFQELAVDYPALVVDKGKRELFITKDGTLTKTNLESLKDHRVSLIVEEKKALGKINILKDNVENVKLFLPLNVGFSYNILVNNWRQRLASINVIEEYGLGGEKTCYENKNVKFDEPVVTGKEIDVEALKAEIEKKIRPHFPIPAYNRAAPITRSPQTEPLAPTQEVGQQKIYKSELDLDEVQNFITKICKYYNELDESQLVRLEEKLGINFYSPEMIKRIQDCSKQDTQMMLLIREINNSQTSDLGKIILKRYFP